MSFMRQKRLVGSLLGIFSITRITCSRLCSGHRAVHTQHLHTMDVEFRRLPGHLVGPHVFCNEISLTVQNQVVRN